ncbi:MAG: hypothetical protein QXH08_00180 [Candidatus Hadarchaeales archaeon]
MTKLTKKTGKVSRERDGEKGKRKNRDEKAIPTTTEQNTRSLRLEDKNSLTPPLASFFQIRR